MVEKYWMQPEFQEAVGDLAEPSLSDEAFSQTLRNQPPIMDQRVPEWYWFDADEQELRLNVHQSYFEIAEASRAEESLFNPVTNTGQPEWVSMVLNWDGVFARLDDDNQQAVHRAAGLAVRELDSMVDAVSTYRFDSGSRTPQLIGTLFGSLTLGGVLAMPLRKYFTEQCKSSGQEEVGVSEATTVVQGIRNLLFGEGEGIGVGVSMLADGRFFSCVGVVDGTGSLEVLPTYLENPFYSSHNLDSPFPQLWAFGGLARLVGEAHRHYEQEVVE